MKKREWLNFLKSFSTEITKQGKDTYMLVFRFAPSKNQEDMIANMRAGRAKVEAIKAQILSAGNSEIERIGDPYKDMMFVTYSKKG